MRHSVEWSSLCCVICEFRRRPRVAPPLVWRTSRVTPGRTRNASTRILAKARAKRAGLTSRATRDTSATTRTKGPTEEEGLARNLRRRLAAKRKPRTGSARDVGRGYVKKKLFLHFVRGNLFIQRQLCRKTRIFVAAHSKDFITLSCVVLTIQHCTDGRTNVSMIAKTRLALRAVARKKNMKMCLANIYCSILHVG